MSNEELLESEIKSLRELLTKEVEHLKELMQQHDKMTALAIEKSENNYNERFSKTNAFREQQNDLIQTFAKSDETRNSIKSIHEKIEENVKSVTDRFEKGHSALLDKITHVQVHLDEKIISSITVQENKFTATDKQMQTLIDANAEISNRGLTDLNKWKENTAGSIRVILAVGGFVVALVLAIGIALITSFF